MTVGATGIDGLRSGLTVACRGFRCLVKKADRNNCRINYGTPLRKTEAAVHSGICLPTGDRAQEGRLAVKPRFQT